MSEHILYKVKVRVKVKEKSKMLVKRQSGEFSKGKIFNMTQGSVAKVSDSVGNVLELAGWILYEDEDKDGNLQTVLALKETNGLISATISKTFIEQFLKMADFMDGEDYNIKVVGGTSNAGRNYITCEVAQ